MKTRKGVKAFLIVSRANIQIGTLPHATLGMFLGANSYQNLFDLSVLIYISLYFTLITFACNLNCLYDRDVDRHYKSSLFHAIEVLGIKRVKILIFLELVLSSLLISLLYMRGHLITTILSLLGLFSGYIYSAAPPRIKAKGFFSPFPVLIGLYMFPLLGGWFLFENSFTAYFILFVIGYAFMNEGFTLVNMCEDYCEDEKEGIRTWAHVFGIKNPLAIANFFTAFGYLCFFSLLFIFLNLNAFLAILFLFIFIFALTYSLKDVLNAFHAKNPQESSKKYGKKMPLWFVITRYPLFFATLLAMI